jgi:hypothetical protein
MVMEVLKHAKAGLVQTIAVRAFDLTANVTNSTQTFEGGDFNMIVAGSSDRSGGDPRISVWKSEVQKEKVATKTTTSMPTNTPEPPHLSAVELLMRGLVVLWAVTWLSERFDRAMLIEMVHVSASLSPEEI